MRPIMLAFATALLCLSIAGAPICAQPQEAPATLSEDLIMPGDEVTVRCFTEDRTHVFASGVVLPDGTMDFPGIGQLSLADQTLTAAQQALLARYQQIYPECVLNLSVRRPEPITEGVPVPPPTEAVPPEEIVPPPAEMTAAEQFAALPRFGLEVFAVPEMPEVLPTGEVTPPAQQGEPAVPRVVPPNYVLQPGDEVAIRAWTDAVEHMKTSVVIDAEGRIYLELLGELTVAGQRLDQVKDMLAQRYQRFFERASISVQLGRTRVIEVRVTGDAERPGKYVLSGAATLFSALYAAHGPSEIGALRGIKLVRAGQQPIAIDLYEYLLEGDESGDLPLQDEDTIFVGPVRAMVGVTGQVRRAARYELNGDNTLAEVLAMAAGLAPTGYAQNMQVWRVTRQAQRELLNISYQGEGAEGADFVLQDGDLVVVEPVLESPDNVVELSGSVRRPGVYQVFEGMTVSDLIKAAQGLDESAHTENAALWRLSEQLDYQLINFDLGAALAGDPAQNQTLRARDKVTVFSEEEVEPAGEVVAQGAVLHPSIVPWARGMKVSDLLLQAGGPAEDAYLPRAFIERIGADQRREAVPIDLRAVLVGEGEADILLERGDILMVASRHEVAARSEVRVSGFVQEPGTYARLQKMRVSDAILAAGGLESKAGDEIEYTPAGARGEVQPQYLRLQRVGDDFAVDPDLVVADNDHIAVLGAGDLIATAPTVTIKGRVGRPGTYALRGTAEKPDTVWQLIQRAEDLLVDGNPNGIVLYRLRGALVADEQDEDLIQVIRTFNRELKQQVLEEGQQSAAMGSQVTRGLISVFTSSGATSVVIPPRELSAEAWVRAVPIDGEALVASRGAEGDFPLADGDVVVVPTTPTTVTVLGAVVRPGAVPYHAGERPFYYLEEVGGTQEDGWINRMVVIAANGRVQPHASRVEVKPGDVILVPSRHQFRRIDQPSTFERVLRLLGTSVTSYLLLK